MLDQLVQLKPLGKWCLIKNCPNRETEVRFFGDLCAPCYAFSTGRPGGEWSQAFRNAMGAAARVLSHRAPHVATITVLSSFAMGATSWHPGDSLYEKKQEHRMENLLDVEKAARDLYRKLLVVHADPQYRGVQALHMIHGGNYTGPQYEAELEALRAALGEQMPRFYICDDYESPCVFTERSWTRLREGSGDLKRCIRHGALICYEREARDRAEVARRPRFVDEEHD